MLAAAFAAGAGAAAFHSPWAGLLAGIVVSVGLALVHGFAAISQRGNQIVSGVAINFLAAGLTVLLGQVWYGQGGRTPQLDHGERFLGLDLGTLGFAPGSMMAKIWGDVISGHNILTWAAFLAVPLTWAILWRTRFGLRLRAVGDNPHAVDTAGVSVAALRYRAVIVCGILCGFAGTYLAVAQSAGFVKRHDRRQGLHRSRRPGLRQVAAAQRTRRLPAVRIARCGRHPSAGDAAAGHRHGAGAGISRRCPMP